MQFTEDEIEKWNKSWKKKQNISSDRLHLCVFVLKIISKICILIQDKFVAIRDV